MTIFSANVTGPELPNWRRPCSTTVTEAFNRGDAATCGLCQWSGAKHQGIRYLTAVAEQHVCDWRDPDIGLCKIAARILGELELHVITDEGDAPAPLHHDLRAAASARQPKASTTGLPAWMACHTFHSIVHAAWADLPSHSTFQMISMAIFSNVSGRETVLLARCTTPWASVPRASIQVNSSVYIATGTRVNGSGTAVAITWRRTLTG